MAFEIPCCICGRGFQFEDVGVTFFISTGVCRSCYREGQRMPAEEWCFGKIESYDPVREECQKLCPDRRLCRLVVQNKLVL